MDQHTIRGLREEAVQEGRPSKALVSLHPGDALSTVLQKLFRNRCSMAPVLTGPSTGLITQSSGAYATQPALLTALISFDARVFGFFCLRFGHDDQPRP